MTITIDHDRARRVFGRLLRALRTRSYPYNVAQLPQALIPEELLADRLRAAQFIFYVCHFMRGALDSTQAIKQLVTLWHASPWMFEPEKVVECELSLVREQLQSAIDYHLDEIAGYWLENSRSLLKKWRGDPRRIFAKAKNYEETVRYIVNKSSKAAVVGTDLFEHEWGFLGFQRKMASMLIYFLVDLKLILPVKGAPPAVDFHLLRVMLANGVLILPDHFYTNGVRYDQVFPHGVKAIITFMEERRVSAVEIGDALWLLSTYLCAAAPGNWSRNRSKERPKRGEKKALPGVTDVVADNLRHVEAYEKTCARCPVRQTCVLNAPSGPYYEVGVFKLHLRKKIRVRKTLFAGMEDHLAPKRLTRGRLERAQNDTQHGLVFDTDPDASS